MFFKSRPDLPSALTSYDILKFLTILTMVADHLGAYIYGGEPWLRVIGRWGFMVWFFLAGYAHTRDLSKPLITGAAILVAINAVLGLPIFPLNALATILVIRAVIDPLAKLAFRSWEWLLYITVIAVCVATPTGQMVEYGTLALLAALFGYAMRHAQTINLSRRGIITFGISVIMILIGYEIFTMPFNAAQIFACAAGMMIMGGALFAFKPAQYQTLTGKLPKAVVTLIQWGGRYALEFYVLHLAVLKIAGYVLETKSGILFNPPLFPDI